MIMIIAEAGLIGFIKTLLIIFLVIFGLRIITRMLIPYLLRYLGRKAESTIRQKFEEMRQEQSTITPEEQRVKKDNKKVGEYIDYEEIE